MKAISTSLFILTIALNMNCSSPKKETKSESDKTTKESAWTVDFYDNFETFNPDNWQDQRIWVNNENHCYVPDGEFGTREVSDGTLKIRVVNIGEKRSCDNFDKHGKQHPDTEYVAGR
ncbi:MAG: hypothetical protein ACJA2C_002211, partial [Marinoscillum sp.]